MADKYADESDGLDGRMDGCLINCCRVVDRCIGWLTLCIILVTTAVCDALLDLVPHIRVPSMGIGNNGSNFVGQLTHKLMKFSGCSTAFIASGYYRVLSLLSLYGDGSQQLWQQSDSTSVCVSDACSGICTVAESVRHVDHSLRVTADFTPTQWRMKRRSMSTLSSRKTKSGWREILGKIVCLLILDLCIRRM